MATHQTATTQFITNSQGLKLAYRRLGLTNGIPLVMLIHFRGNMDFWDPALIDALALFRPVILLDYAGTGKSEGEVPTSFEGWAKNVTDVLDGLGIREVDLLGFSMGGAAAQYVVLARPGLARKVILAGTRTSQTPHTIRGARNIFLALATSTTEEEFRASLALTFFNPNARGQAAAQAYLTRIYSRAQDRSPHLSPELARRQAKAFGKFSEPGEGNPYERIKEFTMPVLVANGDNDTLIPTENSVELAKALPFAQLCLYPDAGHGFLFQYVVLFAKHVQLFLDDDWEGNERGRIVSKI